MLEKIIIYILFFALINYLFHRLGLFDFFIKILNVNSHIFIIYIAFILTLMYLASIIPNNTQLLFHFGYDYLCNMLGISLTETVTAPILNGNEDTFKQLQPLVESIANSLNALNENLANLQATQKTTNEVLANLKTTMLNNDKAILGLKTELQTINKTLLNNKNIFNAQEFTNALASLNKTLIEMKNLTEQGWIQYSLSHNIKIDKFNEFKESIDNVILGLNQVGIKIENLSTVFTNKFDSLSALVSTKFESFNNSMTYVGNAVIDLKNQNFNDFKKLGSLIEIVSTNISSLNLDVHAVKENLMPTTDGQLNGNNSNTSWLPSWDIFKNKK